MKTNLVAGAAVAAILVSAAALMGASGAVAAEPLRLNATQMDAVTAGLALSKTSAQSLAQGKHGTLALTATTTNATAKNQKQAKTSGVGAAIAAGDQLAATKADSLSLIADNNAHAGVQTTTSGAALGDKAYSDSGVATTAAQSGGVIGAQGAGTTYAEGGSGVNVSGGTGASAAGTMTAKTGAGSTGYATLYHGLVTTGGSAFSFKP